MKASNEQNYKGIDKMSDSLSNSSLIKNIAIILIMTIFCGSGCTTGNLSSNSNAEILTESTPTLESGGTDFNSVENPTMSPVKTIEILKTPNVTPPTLTISSPTSTPAQHVNGVSNVLFRLAYGQYFDAFYLGDLPQHTQQKILSEFSQDPNAPLPRLGNALKATFANHSNKIAYWTSVTEFAELYVYDLVTEQEELIYVDTENKFPIHQFGSRDFELIWSADDRHLIVTNNLNLEVSLIYHLETKFLEPWPWKCSQIAMSPKTNKVSTWCESINSMNNQFAVIEWNGEIWLSNLLPDNTISTSDLQDARAFSTDGTVAFFDSKGNLATVNIDGNKSVLVENIAWWKNTSIQASKITIPANPIQWSDSGDRILVFAIGQEVHDCPNWSNIADPTNAIYEIPCWQTFNLESKKIDWKLGDSFKDKESLYWQFDTASLSVDGKYLAVTSESLGLFLTFIVNVETNESLYWDSGASSLKWASQP